MKACGVRKPAECRSSPKRDFPLQKQRVHGESRELEWYHGKQSPFVSRQREGAFIMPLREWRSGRNDGKSCGGSNKEKKRRNENGSTL